MTMAPIGRTTKAAAKVRKSKLSVAVEDHDRRILALEHVNPILQIRRHPADQPEGFTVRQFEEIGDQLTGVWQVPTCAIAVFLP